MSSKTSELFDAFDLTDLRFFLLIAKKFKILSIYLVLVTIFVLFISLNMEKNISEATIVIEPDENKIVNINEAYSTFNNNNRVNNLIAVLESDEVISHIVDDEENELKFRELYSNVEIFLAEYLQKKLLIKNI